MSGVPQPTEPWRHGEAHVNGVRLHYVEQGEGPLLVLLHGFPDFWYGWRFQIPALAGAGFHVVAPDLRGYNTSDRPRGVRPYRVSELVGDVTALVRHLGVERAHVAGHDWGGMVAWHLAMHHPEIVERLVIANAPHPAAFRRELKTPDQVLRSWYVAFFQLPWLPEAALRRDDYAALRAVFRKEPARPEAFSRDDIARYRETFARPGALTAMLNYYRALLRFPPPPTRVIEAPTLLVWGERDPHLSPRLTHGLERWVPRLRVERFPQASHWVLTDAPEQVNRSMAGFLRDGG